MCIISEKVCIIEDLNILGKDVLYGVKLKEMQMTV